MKEIRIAEIRADAPAGAESLYLVGMPIVYDTPTKINDPAGEYIEIIKRGALDGADLTDVRLFYGHDVTKVPLARTPRTMQLEVTPAGLQMRAALADTTDAKTVYEAANTRTITKIEKVLECSVVAFPAYPTASVEARSAQAAGKQRLADRKAAKILVNQILKVR